jgi:hypothetical protein
MSPGITCIFNLRFCPARTTSHFFICTLYVVYSMMSSMIIVIMVIIIIIVIRIIIMVRVIKIMMVIPTKWIRPEIVPRNRINRRCLLSWGINCFCIIIFIIAHFRSNLKKFYNHCKKQYDY